MLDIPTRALDPVTLKAVLDALPEPVVVIDAGIRIVTANAPALDVVPTLRVGEPLALFLRDPAVLDGAARVLEAGSSEVVPWRDRVPVDRLFDVTITRLFSAVDTPLLLLSLRDRTETQRVERMRADFIANASHELRTPLASLLGFVETLQGPARGDAAARERFLAIMAEQARRMARLVDDLLSLSRIEQNLHLRPSKPVDFDTVVRHVVDTLGPLAAEKGVEIGIESPGPVIVLGDRDELVRVAENLIENAIKYGCAAGADARPGANRIAITLTKTARDATLAVRDHGPGIAAQHLPRLTERFYRVDAGQSRANGGTGLGLALVKHIMARHRGRLAVDSRPGQGATFSAAVPLYQGGSAGSERRAML